MTSFSLSEEIKFIKLYYELLCNDINRISGLHSQDYKCLVVRENHDHQKFSEKHSERHSSIKACLSKQVLRIFISSISALEVGQGSFMINVVSQFVYVDRTQHRVSHQLVIKRESEFRIVSEIFTILDEEIIYDSYESRICISNPKKEFHQVVQDVSKYATVETVEHKGGKFMVKFNRQSNIPFEELRNKIEAEGYKIEKIF